MSSRKHKLLWMGKGDGVEKSVTVGTYDTREEASTAMDDHYASQHNKGASMLPPRKVSADGGPFYATPDHGAYTIQEVLVND